MHEMTERSVNARPEEDVVNEALALFRAGRLDDCERVFAEGLRIYPDSPLLLSNRAMNLYCTRKSYALALADLQIAIEQTTVGDRAPWMLVGFRGRVLCDLYHQALAREVLRKRAMSGPEERGEGDVRTLESAEHDLEYALHQEAGQADVEMLADLHAYRGFARYALGRFDDARFHVDEAVRLTDHGDERALALQAKLNGLLGLHPVEALLKQAGSEFESHNYPQAIVWLDRLLTLEPMHSRALALRGDCKYRFYGPLEAMADLDRAIEIDGNPAARYVRAHCHMDLLQIALAKADFEACLETGTDAQMRKGALNAVAVLNVPADQLGSNPLQGVTADGTHFQTTFQDIGVRGFDSVFNRGRLPEGQASLWSISATEGRPWFDPTRPCDRDVLGLDPLPRTLEVDSLRMLQLLADVVPRSPWWECLIYQQWPASEHGGRAFEVMNPGHVPALVEALSRVPVRKLYIVAAGFWPGTIRALADALEQAGCTLEALGLFWYFTDDSIVDPGPFSNAVVRKMFEAAGHDATDIPFPDDPTYAEEIGEAVRLLQVEHLSILTGKFDSSVEQELADAFCACPTLKRVCVFHKATRDSYPRISTPRIDAVVSIAGDARASLVSRPPARPSLSQPVASPTRARALAVQATEREEDHRAVSRTSNVQSQGSGGFRLRMGRAGVAAVFVVVVCVMLFLRSAFSPSLPRFTLSGKSTYLGGAQVLMQGGEVLAREGDPVAPLLARLGPPSDKLTPFAAHFGFYAYDSQDGELMIRVKYVPNGTIRILAFSMKTKAP